MCGRPICQDVESLDPGSVRWMAMKWLSEAGKARCFRYGKVGDMFVKAEIWMFFSDSQMYFWRLFLFLFLEMLESDLMVKICATRWEKTRCSAVRFFTKNARQLWGKWPSKKPGKIWFCPKIVPSRSLQESNMGVLTEKVIYKWGIFHWNVWLPEDTRTSSSGVYNSSLFLLLVNWLFWGVCPIFRQTNVNRAGTEAHMQLIWLMDSI